MPDPTPAATMNPISQFRRWFTTPRIIAEWKWEGNDLSDLPRAAWRDFRWLIRRAIYYRIIEFLAGDDLIITGDVYGPTTGPAPVQVLNGLNLLVTGSFCTHDGPAVIISRGCKPPAPAPAVVPQSGPTDGPAVQSREPASVAPEASPSPADRMALAVCTYNPLYPTPCQEICPQCRKQSAAVAHEIARQLRQRHGGSSQVADWLDGVGCHPGTVQGGN